MEESFKNSSIIGTAKGLSEVSEKIKRVSDKEKMDRESFMATMNSAMSVGEKSNEPFKLMENIGIGLVQEEDNKTPTAS
jgi:hypothetical protein